MGGAYSQCVHVLLRSRNYDVGCVEVTVFLLLINSSRFVWFFFLNDYLLVDNEEQRMSIRCVLICLHFLKCFFLKQSASETSKRSISPNLQTLQLLIPPRFLTTRRRGARRKSRSCSHNDVAVASVCKNDRSDTDVPSVCPVAHTSRCPCAQVCRRGRIDSLSSECVTRQRERHVLAFHLR